MDKNIILFVQNAPLSAVERIRAYGKKTKEVFRVALIRDKSKKTSSEKTGAHEVDIDIVCDLSKDEKIVEALLPYQDELLALTCRGEDNMEYFMKVIPNVPYLRTPTTESISWSIDKVKMRERFMAYDKSITPQFLVVEKNTKKAIQDIKKKVGFPLILKPSGLAASLFVSICFHEEDLEGELKKILKNIEKVYLENGRKRKPKILAEQFLEGGMYSVDAYVDSRGKISFCPLVHVKTGRSIGFDDFFGYQRLAPTALKKESIEGALEVGKKSVYALALRSTSVHIELIRTEDGWKVIEVGPRIGGFRDSIYLSSFGINHAMNDIFTRIPRKVVIPKKVKGYTAVLNFFPKEEGVLSQIKGIKKLKEIKSITKVDMNKKLGDKCQFAKNGGKSVCDITLFNQVRSDLLADIRRLEQCFEIKTKKTKDS